MVKKPQRCIDTCSALVDIRVTQSCCFVGVIRARLLLTLSGNLHTAQPLLPGWYRVPYMRISYLSAKAGVCIPGQLRKLLALFSKVEQGQGYPRLRIDNNPWEEPPEAVVKKGMAAVSEYFADLFQEGVAPVPRRMIKVVLVGQEGAGKTR